MEKNIAWHGKKVTNKQIGIVQSAKKISYGEKHCMYIILNVTTEANPQLRGRGVPILINIKNTNFGCKI